ncbi:MAG: hypothetical protein HYV60_00560 [Planctomycetia bacterium]|nr:hypothetical protein [Planctomycetia bacterium]
MDRYHAALTLIAALFCDVLLLPALLSQFDARPKCGNSEESLAATGEALDR